MIYKLEYKESMREHLDKKYKLLWKKKKCDKKECKSKQTRIDNYVKHLPKMLIFVFPIDKNKKKNRKNKTEIPMTFDMDVYMKQWAFCENRISKFDLSCIISCDGLTGEKDMYVTKLRREIKKDMRSGDDV